MPVGIVTWQPTALQSQTEARRELALLIKGKLRQIIVDSFNEAHASDPKGLRLGGISEAKARIYMGDIEDENVGDVEVTVSVSPGEADGHIMRENEIRAALTRRIDALLQDYPRSTADAGANGIDVDLHFERMVGCSVNPLERRVLASWGGKNITNKSIDDL